VPLSLGVKLPGLEADHSSPSSTEFRNAWSCTSTPQYNLMAGWSVKIKHRDSFTFKTLLHHFPGETEENQGKPSLSQDSQSSSWDLIPGSNKQETGATFIIHRQSTLHDVTCNQYSVSYHCVQYRSCIAYVCKQTSHAMTRVTRPSSSPQYGAYRESKKDAKQPRATMHTMVLRLSSALWITQYLIYIFILI
jgi:hypothetical protein